jgi:hypothetical protein
MVLFVIFSKSNDNYNNDKKFFGLTIDILEELSKEDTLTFKKFHLKYSRSEFSSFQELIIYGFLSNPNSYLNEAFDIINYLFEKTSFIHNEKLMFYVRQLISVVYPLVSYAQKTKINKMILAIKDSNENKLFINPYTQQKNKTNSVGNQMFKFLSAIPQELRLLDIKISSKYSELKRRFGKVFSVDQNLNKSSVSKRNNKPYLEVNYNKMRLENWKKTFYKYNGQNEDTFRVGIFENGRAFEDYVIIKPTFFLPLIEQIINDDKINNAYLIHGLNGLVKAKISPKIISNL